MSSHLSQILASPPSHTSQGSHSLISYSPLIHSSTMMGRNSKGRVASKGVRFLKKVRKPRRALDIFILDESSHKSTFMYTFKSSFYLESLTKTNSHAHTSLQRRTYRTKSSNLVDHHNTLKILKTTFMYTFNTFKSHFCHIVVLFILSHSLKRIHTLIQASTNVSYKKV